MRDSAVVLATDAEGAPRRRARGVASCLISLTRREARAAGAPARLSEAVAPKAAVSMLYQHVGPSFTANEWSPE